MADAIQELEDTIRRERFEQTWRTIGKVMVWVSVAVIIATIMMVVRDHQRQEAAMAQTNLFIRGVESLVAGDHKSALPIFKELAQDADAAMYPLVLMRLAQAQMGLGDTDAAVRTYKLLAQTDSLFADLAKMMLPPVKGDVSKPHKSSPFYYSMSEVRGWRLLDTIDKRDNGIAQLLALYEDTNTPLSMRVRVTEALQEIAPERLYALDRYMQAKAGKKAVSMLPTASTAAVAE